MDVEQDMTAVDECGSEDLEKDSDASSTVDEGSGGDEPRKKRRRTWNIIDEKTDEDEKKRVNPRLHLIVGPFRFYHLCNLEELRESIQMSDVFVGHLLRPGGTRAQKRGYVWLSYKTVDLAYWNMDILSGLRFLQKMDKNFGCWMMNSDTASDIMNNTPSDLDAIKSRLDEIGPDDVSQRTLRFGNLPLSVNEEKLKEFIADAKAEIILPMFEGKPRGCAFVEFESEERAADYLGSYDQHQGLIDGSRPSVRKFGGGKSADFTLYTVPLSAREPVRGMRRPRVRGMRRPSTRSARYYRNRGPRRTFPEQAREYRGDGNGDRRGFVDYFFNEIMRSGGGDSRRCLSIDDLERNYYTSNYGRGGGGGGGRLYEVDFNQGGGGYRGVHWGGGGFRRRGGRRSFYGPY